MGRRREKSLKMLGFLLEETHPATYFLWLLAGFLLPSFHVHPELLVLTIHENECAAWKMETLLSSKL